MSHAFETLMTSVDPPLVVVTTAAEGVRAGCLVGFHLQLGMEVERYGIGLSKANHTYRVALRATHLAVHFLTDRDIALAERFGTHSGEDTDKFADLDLRTDHDIPLLQACPNRMLLERIAVLDDGSDHVLITTRVLSAESEKPFEPLRVSDADHLDAGHPAQDRAIHP